MVGYGHQRSIIDGARRSRYKRSNSSLYAFFMFQIEVSHEFLLKQASRSLLAFCIQSYRAINEDFIKLCLHDCPERLSSIPISSTVRIPCHSTNDTHLCPSTATFPYLTKGTTCKTSTFPDPNNHANNPTIATLPATTPLPLSSSSSIYLPLRPNHNKIHRQPHNPQHRTHTQRNNIRLRILPPGPKPLLLLLPIHTQYIPRCRLMLEIFPRSSTCVRIRSVWITAGFLLGAVGVGDGVGRERGEGYGVDYYWGFGDVVVV